jgi:hypothetical protein
MTTTQCCVEYIEDYVKILYITNSELSKIDSGVFLEIENVAAEEATEALEKGKVVLVPRAIGGIIQPNDMFITDGIDELQMIKDGTVFRARKHLNNDMAMFNAFNYFEFTLCNNKLASQGIFIHDGNREEKYIEIINSADESLIECLETYLNAWDKISDTNKYYKDFLAFEKSVQEAKSPEEVQGLADNYRYMV